MKALAVSRHVLNEVAALSWLMADGKRCMPVHLHAVIESES